MRKLYFHSRPGMSRIERKMGRLMRAPDGHDSGGGSDNQGGGNSAPDGNESGQQNNAGGGFDASAFWDGPAPSADAAPSGESAGNDTGESGNQNEFGQQLTQRLAGLTFGEPVFDQKIAEEINEGNYAGVQNKLNAMGQQIVREALAMQVQILRPFADQLLEQVRNETQQTFNSRDNVESLERLFPAAKNPVMAKTIGPIYEQALKNAKGNRESAVAQTKEMLRFMAGESAADLNIDVAPRGQGDRGGPTPVTNWLDELTGRK